VSATWLKGKALNKLVHNCFKRALLGNAKNDRGGEEPGRFAMLHELIPQNSQTHEVSRFEGKGYLLFE